MFSLEEAQKLVSDLRLRNSGYMSHLESEFFQGAVDEEDYCGVEHLLQMYDDALEAICCVDDALSEGKLPSEAYLDSVTNYCVVTGIKEWDLVDFDAKRAELICELLEDSMAEVESYIS